MVDLIICSGGVDRCMEEEYTRRLGRRITEI